MGVDELDLKVSIWAAIEQPGKMCPGLERLEPRLDWRFGRSVLNYQVIKDGESGSTVHLSGVKEGAIYA